MSSKKNNKNIAEHIRQLRSRKEFETFWELREAFTRIGKILIELKKSDTPVHKELIKYVPVNLVGSMESFLRSTCAKLINHDEKYLNNAKDLLKSNLDWELMRQIQKREFTLGELISHQLSFSNFDQIATNFKTILGTNFIKTLQEFDPTPYFIKPYFSDKIKSFNSISKHIFSDLNDLFEIRHIVCHEMASTMELDLKKVTRIVTSTRLFNYQVYYFVYPILFPDTFEEEEILAERAKEEFFKAEKDLEEYVAAIKENPMGPMECNVDYDLLIKSQEHWINYRNTYLEAVCANLKDDPRNTLYYEEARDLTIERITDLKFDFENLVVKP
ncbi:hypothetical protein CNR22_20340 [Sphingobacteriaceae bacterium]|nr:hypothetical protein CNR22_20340 [Sphingobacteriaceae bacterium]